MGKGSLRKERWGNGQRQVRFSAACIAMSLAILTIFFRWETLNQGIGTFSEFPQLVTRELDWQVRRFRMDYYYPWKYRPSRKVRMALRELSIPEDRMVFPIKQEFWKHHSIHKVIRAAGHTFPKLAVGPKGEGFLLTAISDSDFSADARGIANFNRIASIEGITVTPENVRLYADFFLQATIPLYDDSLIQKPMAEIAATKEGASFVMTLPYQSRGRWNHDLHLKISVNGTVESSNIRLR